MSMCPVVCCLPLSYTSLCILVSRTEHILDGNRRNGGTAWFDAEMREKQEMEREKEELDDTVTQSKVKTSSDMVTYC